MNKLWLFVPFIITACSRYSGIKSSNPVCGKIEDIAYVITRECGDVIPQPEMGRDSAHEIEAWLALSYGEEQEMVTTAREACIPESLNEVWEQGIDCAELPICLADHGIALPDPWPEESYSNDVTVCNDPALVNEDDDGDGDPD